MTVFILVVIGTIGAVGIVYLLSKDSDTAMQSVAVDVNQNGDREVASATTNLHFENLHASPRVQ